MNCDLQAPAVNARDKPVELILGWVQTAPHLVQHDLDRPACQPAFPVIKRQALCFIDAEHKDGPGLKNPSSFPIQELFPARPAIARRSVLDHGYPQAQQGLAGLFYRGVHLRRTDRRNGRAEVSSHAVKQAVRQSRPEVALDHASRRLLALVVDAGQGHGRRI